jgi:hypothetical protein
MIDRVLFVLSRSLAPASAFVILAAIALEFGEVGVAQYTYALAIVAPAYFICSLNMPVFIAVQQGALSREPELLWLRTFTVIATLPVGVAAFLVAGTEGAVIGGVWLIKTGEITFEFVSVYVVTDASRQRRGRTMLLLETVRFAVGQTSLWTMVGLVNAELSTTILAVGAANLTYAAFLLFTVPGWRSFSVSWIRLVTCAQHVLHASAPMTISGAMVALVVSLPRLLLDGAMNDGERAMVGVAQIVGSVAALFFNAGWMYELPRIKISARAMDASALLAIHVRLSTAFVLALAVGALALYGVPAGLLQLVGVTGTVDWLLPATVFVLALPHCISAHRDVLKVLGASWFEVGVLAVSLVLGMMVWYASSLLEVEWQITGTAVVLGMLIAQLVLSITALRYVTNGPDRIAARS